MVRPPRGKTVLCATQQDAGVLIWEPGNGSRYVLVVTEIPASASAAVGGPVMISLASMADNTFVSHAGNPAQTATWMASYVRDKWKRIHGIGEHAPFLAMLLNWAMGGTPAQAYAESLWQKHVGTGAKVTRLRRA